MLSPARVYSPETGAFLSRDPGTWYMDRSGPIGGQFANSMALGGATGGLNLPNSFLNAYDFGKANPIQFVDSTGLVSLSLIQAAITLRRSERFVVEGFAGGNDASQPWLGAKFLANNPGDRWDWVFGQVEYKRWRVDCFCIFGCQADPQCKGYDIFCNGFIRYQMLISRRPGQGATRLVSLQNVLQNVNIGNNITGRNVWGHEQAHIRDVHQTVGQLLPVWWEQDGISNKRNDCFKDPDDCANTAGLVEGKLQTSLSEFINSRKFGDPTATPDSSHRTQPHKQQGITGPDVRPPANAPVNPDGEPGPSGRSQRIPPPPRSRIIG